MQGEEAMGLGILSWPMPIPDQDWILLCALLAGLLGTAAWVHAGLRSRAHAAENARLRATIGSLVDEVMANAERERALVAVGLRDEAVQSLLVARHDLIEGPEGGEGARRAEQLIGEAIREVRAVVGDLERS